MCSERCLVIEDDGFESVSLEDRTCDICLQDTAEPLGPCNICLKSYFDSATAGFHVLPEVIHKGRKGHERCFEKSHEILTGIDSHCTTFGHVSPNILRKSFGENFSDFATEVQSRVAENILWIFRRHCSQSQCRSRTLTQSGVSLSPQWARREFSDTARLSASMTNLSADLTDAKTCRKLDGADLSNQSRSNRRKSECWTSKAGFALTVDDKSSDSDADTSHEALKRTDSWNRLKPVKKRNIVITVTDGDIDLKDIVQYSPKDLASSDDMLMFKADKMTNGKDEISRESRGEERLSTSSGASVEEDKKFPTYTESELVSMTKDELDELSLEVSKRIHAISSKLVDLVQERHFLREEVDVRHIFIEKLLKLNLSSEPV